MALQFYKYQGTGNDFIMIDNRKEVFFKNDTKLVQSLCDRRFGIGADGLILIENHPDADFNMIYYNADATKSMCGNGARCAVAFAKYLGIIENETRFNAIDGLHSAYLKEGNVHLSMQDVIEIKDGNGFTFINTGSPHHIEFRNQLQKVDIKTEGRSIRNSELYGKPGSNVNFVEQLNNDFAVRTYERGVEDETLSCGTGVTAVALAMHHLNKTKETTIKLLVQGGELWVSFKKAAIGYEEIHLIGPATFVYSGIWP